MRSRSRWTCAALVSVLAAAACTSGGDDVSGSSPSSTGSTPLLSDEVPTEAPAPDTSTPGSTTVVDTSVESGDTPPSTEAVPDEAPTPSGVGGFAAFYLRRAASDTIVIEIRSQSGQEPSSSTVDHVRTLLAAASGKSVDVVSGSVAGSGRDWSGDDLRALADEGRTQSRDSAVLRLLFVGGTLGGDDEVLGVAVRSDVAAVFGDQIDAAAGLLGDRSRLERAVTAHEVGHLLGLVDLVVDRGREDPEHPGHSTNDESVMFWAVESSLVGAILGGGPPTTFDDDDRADLAAIRDS